MEVDLSEVEYWNPGTIVGVLLIVERLRLLQAEGVISTFGVTYPMKGRAPAYASLIGFPEMVLQMFGGRPPARGRAKLNAEPIIPITTFATFSDVERIANSMADLFQTELVGLSFLLQPCHIVFSELADNVLQHAEVSLVWWRQQKFGIATGQVGQSTWWKLQSGMLG